MIYSKEQIEKKYNALPKDVREAILANDTENIISDIGEKHNMRLDQIGELFEAVQFVMLGILSPKDFIRDLYDRLRISDKQRVREIARDVNEKVFHLIRESLQQIHNVSRDEPIEIKNKNYEKLETTEEIMKEIEKPEHIKNNEQKIINQEKNEEINNQPTRREEETQNPISEAKMSGRHAMPQKFSIYEKDNNDVSGASGEIDNEIMPSDENRSSGYSDGQDPYREQVD